ncbi:hypothetical protein UFOVP67_54 [uncultured Caudovirales phage]|uniref:Uncharacterized protein n=1 Tax=uncultured Caudovirales phage TaxID=2100421 RepID=A0A6J5T9W0_9CAUD|nr:hypothetical protein UFOVP67_54 [uncultured Caudovirales phage]
MSIDKKVSKRNWKNDKKFLEELKELQKGDYPDVGRDIGFYFCTVSSKYGYLYHIKNELSPYSPHRETDYRKLVDQVISIGVGYSDVNR